MTVDIDAHCRRKVRASCDAQPAAETPNVWRIAADDDRVDLALGDKQRKMLPRQIRRAQNEPAGDAVQLDERKRGGQLIPRQDENRTAREFVKTPAQARAGEHIVQADAAGASAHCAAAGPVRGLTEFVPK